MSASDTELIATLRDSLPRIQRNPVSFACLNTVTIDCEWDEDTGVLELIGIGNSFAIVQLWWNEVDDAQRREWIDCILDMVRRVPVVYHNADADIRKMREYGIPITVEMHAQLEDTMLMHGVLHSEEEHSLEYLQGKFGKLFAYKHLRKVAGAESVYNACDLVETLNVYDALLVQLEADPAAERVYREERLALLPYIIHDEERGIRVNQPAIYPLYDKFNTRREQATKLAQAYTGWPVNLNSPDQLQLAVYNIAGFPVQYAKAAPGQQGPPTLGKDALAKLRASVGTELDPDIQPTLETALANIDDGGHPLLEARYLYFGAQQALSHYIEPCMYLEGDTVLGLRERIYPETRQHVQASGRPSIVKPAMQQLRKETETIVWPDINTTWVCFDWSNIETWLLGVFANDPLILEAKAKDWDTHTLNFCDITGTAYPPVLTKALHSIPECAPWRAALNWKGEDDDRRVFAKRFVYRIHYRGNPKYAGDIPGAKALGFNATRLVEASERYLAAHPAIPAYWAQMEHEIDQHSVVYAPGEMPRRLTSLYPNARYREGCNHPMQGGVAWVYNSTRLAIHKAAPWAEFMYGKHDSQIWQVPTERADEFETLIRPIVQREFLVSGQSVSFPATFKRRIE